MALQWARILFLRLRVFLVVGDDLVRLFLAVIREEDLNLHLSLLIRRQGVSGLCGGEGFETGLRNLMSSMTANFHSAGRGGTVEINISVAAAACFSIYCIEVIALL